MKLFCFPYLGGSGSMYRDLARHLAGHFDVAPVELPGRGRRRSESCTSDWNGMTTLLVESIRSDLDQPYALLGYSFGAMLALEVSHAICSQRRAVLPKPQALVVCALAGPRTIRHGDRLRDLSDMEMFRGLFRRGAMPAETLESTELIELSAPFVRADLTLFETYAPPASPLFDIPVHVYFGSDDHDVGDGYRSWREETTGALTERCFAGGHMFIQDDVEALASALIVDLQTSSPFQGRLPCGGNYGERTRV